MHALINWLWQASALVLILSLLVAPWRGLSAATRYAAWWIVLALVLALPLGSVLVPYAGPILMSVSASDLPMSTTTTIVLPNPPGWLGVLLLCLWVEWTAFSAVRLARALTTLSEARASCLPFPVDRENRLPLWRRHRGEGRGARLMLSTRVRGAAVLGLRHPIIAVSPSLAHRLADADLDQVIAHELAHVRRRDDIATLGQAIVDALAGFHPALRIVQRRLQLEREMACDDWVVRIHGSAKRYAACLTRVAAVQGLDGELLAPAALAPAQLTTRVTRLLDLRRNRSRASHAGLLAAAPLLVALAIVVGEFDLVAAPGSMDETTMPRVGGAFVGRAAPGVDDVTPAGTRTPGTVDPLVAATRQAAERRNRQPRSARGPDDAQKPAPRSSTAPALTTAEAPRAEPRPPAVIHAESILAIDPFPGTATSSLTSAEHAAETPSSWPATPWTATASAGAAIGQGSEKAAVATAGFLTRMSKSIARIF